MTQYNMLNVKLSNSQLHKLKSRIKNGIEVTLNLSSNLIGDSNDEINFPHKFLSTNTQVSKICGAFANGSSANIKFSKTQLSKIVQLRGVICGRRKLGETFLDKQINRFNKEYITGSKITLTNNEIKDIMKVMKSLENKEILLKETTRKITSREGGFLNCLRPLMTAGLPLMKSLLPP